jgi:glycosyltransferase involved in cell wall biosynthesis
MRVLVIHECNLPYGGGERYLHLTCQALREMGHRVALVCAKEWNGGFIPSDETYGVARSVGLRTGLRVRRVYGTTIQDENPDVIYINGIVRHFVSPFILRRIIRSRPSVLFVHHSVLICHTGKKVIPSTQGRCEWPLGRHCFQEGCVGAQAGPPLEQLRTAALRMWRLQSVRGCRRVIVPSQYMYHEMVRNGFPPRRLRVLPCFTERTQIPDVRARGREILWVGRADGGKGLDRFFQCLAMLRGREWRAVVVGDDTATPEVRAMAEAAGIGGRVRCLGRLEGADLDQQYAASRVVAFTSGWAETFGQVGIEAMAFGKPVVAFDVGGVSEWLTDEVTGFLVNRNDVAAMADRLSLLLADDALCERMGAAGRSAVEARFRRQHHIPKLLEIFQEAIVESRGALPARSPARQSAPSA